MSQMPRHRRRHLLDLLDAAQLQEVEGSLVNTTNGDSVGAEEQTGTVELTNCTRPNVDGAITAAVAVIEAYAKEQGHEVEVDVESRDICESQVTSGDSMYLWVTLTVGGMKQKYYISAQKTPFQECQLFHEYNGTYECVDKSNVFELMNITEDSALAVAGSYLISVTEDNAEGKSAGDGSVPYVQKDESVTIYTNQTVLQSDGNSESDDNSSSLTFAEVYGAVLLALLTGGVFILIGVYIINKRTSARYSLMQ
ncbi:hypothetical protein CYMTET_54808, partial [Cymbomonas tetramitiformis]